MPRATTPRLNEREADPPPGTSKTESSDAKLKALRQMVSGERGDGVAEDGERRAITLAGLQKEFGSVKGRRLYFGISQFLRAGADETYTPAIQLPTKGRGRTPAGESVDLTGQREAIEAMLAEAKGSGDSTDEPQGGEE